jgi:hypothetical protein
MTETLKHKPYIPPSPKDDRKFAVFVIHSGVFTEEALVPLSVSDAKDKAYKIIASQWAKDRQHDSAIADEEYARRKDAVYNLQSVDLNENDDLIICEVTSFD